MHYQSFRRLPWLPKGNKAPRTTTCTTSLVNNYQKKVFPPAGASTARDSSDASGPAPAASTASGLPPQGSTPGNGLPEEGPLPILPMKRPADALYTTGAYLLNYDDFGEAELTENVTINEARLPFAPETFYTLLLKQPTTSRRAQRPGHLRGHQPSRRDHRRRGPPGVQQPCLFKAGAQAA